MNVAECSPLGSYNPGEPPVPAALLWVALVHCYCVVIFGILCNTLVLWCVATCTKTLRPIKVLLFSVFLPVLLMCLVTWPVTGVDLAAQLMCDPGRISETVISNTMVVHVILMQKELTSIATIAVVRAAAIWAPHRPLLGMQDAVVLVVTTCTYAILTSLAHWYSGFRNLMVIGHGADPQTVTSITIFFLVNTTLPGLITAAAYILMIFVIQRNKRRLVTYQQQARVTTTMDQATQAILAVFISNLVFELPHSIFHLTGKQPQYLYVIFHLIYSTHFVIDPLAYMWFNTSCREKVLSSIRKVIESMSSSITRSVLQARSITSREQQ